MIEFTKQAPPSDSDTSGTSGGVESPPPTFKKRKPRVPVKEQKTKRSRKRTPKQPVSLEAKLAQLAKRNKTRQHEVLTKWDENKNSSFCCEASNARAPNSSAQLSCISGQ
jgi:hypothetical protein